MGMNRQGEEEEDDENEDVLTFTILLRLST